MVRRRLPPVRERVAAFLACLIPVVCWAVFHMLHDGLPVWTRQMSSWDLIGTMAYVLAFALLESAIVFAALLVLSMLLPLSWFRDKFVALGTSIVYVSAAWAVLAQRHTDALRGWPLRWLAPYAGAYLISLLIVAVLVHRSRRAEHMIGSFVRQVTALGAAYLLVMMVAVAIVLIRIL
jgi:hypothetical protein